MNYSVLVSFHLSLKFHTVSFRNFGNLLSTYAFWIDCISNSADTFSDQWRKQGAMNSLSYHFTNLFSTGRTHYLIKTIKKFNSYLPEQINRRKQQTEVKKNSIAMVFFLPSFSSINMVTTMPNKKGKYLILIMTTFLCVIIYQFIFKLSYIDQYIYLPHFKL